MPSDGLFGPLSGTPAMSAAVSDEAWLQAMLDTEAALARGGAAAGLFPVDAAERIAAGCRAESFDLAALGQAAVASGTPVVPVLTALRASLPAEVARFVHWGATSQDVLDTAAMLVSRHALGILVDGLDAACARSADLSRRHRSTVMAGRTLLQQAVPITFGLKCAGWLTGLAETRARLDQLRQERLAVQLGGAAGTLAALGAAGPAVVAAVAAALGLAEPPLPWHTNRVRMAEVAAALGVTLGVTGKVATDVILLAQTEVGEVDEADGQGRGGSSTMPHKRNPVGAVAVNACVARGQPLVGVILRSMIQEHERAAGAWQAEWETMTELFTLTGTAVERLGEVLGGVEVHPDRMRENLHLSSGLVMAESVVMSLAPRMDRAEATALVEAAVRAHLSPAEIAAAVDPSGYLGATDQFIDRALRAWRPGG